MRMVGCTAIYLFLSKIYTRELQGINFLPHFKVIAKGNFVWHNRFMVLCVKLELLQCF